ncbi:hypothetical protein C8Q74DRAFT_1372889 [Fomes fomentarius]|nr:hypothetical protein C8Q74DRAFT_1372889 [Fomes fomentarius]
MALFYVYRLASFVVAMFAAIVLLGFCSHSIAAMHHAGAVSATYLNMGVAAAGASLISLPIILAVDFIGSGKGIPTLLELPWVFILLILFVASGATTYGNVSVLWTSGISCDQLKDASIDFGGQYGSVQIGQDYVKICKDAHPIGIMAWTGAVILGVYTIVYVATTFLKSKNDSSAWSSSAKALEK